MGKNLIDVSKINKGNNLIDRDKINAGKPDLSSVNNLISDVEIKLKELEDGPNLPISEGALNEVKHLLTNLGNIMKTVNFKNIDEKTAELDNLLSEAKSLQISINEEIEEKKGDK